MNNEKTINDAIKMMEQLHQPFAADENVNDYIDDEKDDVDDSCVISEKEAKRSTKPAVKLVSKCTYDQYFTGRRNNDQLNNDQLEEESVWVDLSEFCSFDDFSEWCLAWFHCDKHDDAEDCVRIIDHENFFDIWLDYNTDFMDEDGFNCIINYADKLWDSNIDQDALNAYIENYEPQDEDELDKFKNMYIGHFYNEEDFGRKIMEMDENEFYSTLDIYNKMRFFDFEAYADSQLETDYTWVDGYVFREYKN